jgi:hypothetical protein
MARAKQGLHICCKKLFSYTSSMQNMFIIVELLYETWGRRERKRERVATIL